MAARQGRPGGAGAARGGERAHAGGHGPPRGPAADDLRGDQGPDAGDRPVGPDAQPRLLVLRPLVRGPRVRRQLPGTGHRPGRLDSSAARRGLRPRPARPARRAGAARPRPARRGARLLLPGRLVGEHEHAAARLRHRHHGRRAVHGAREGPRHRRAAARHDHRRPRRRHLAPRQRVVLLRDRRRHLAARQGVASPARHRPDRRRAGPPRDRSTFLDRGRTHPQRPVRAGRLHLQDHLRGAAPRHRGP